jgi:hypothetical protein
MRGASTFRQPHRDSVPASRRSDCRTSPLGRWNSSSGTRVVMKGWARLGHSEPHGRPQLKPRRSVARPRRSAPIAHGFVIAYSIRRVGRHRRRNGGLQWAALSWTLPWMPPLVRWMPIRAVTRTALPVAPGPTRCGIHIRPSETRPYPPHREIQGADHGGRRLARSVASTQPLCRPTTLRATV